MTKFSVHLENFEGPFDLLLHLIAKNQLDVTQLALAKVTEEFLAYLPSVKDFSQTSEFLVVAATLLNLKAQRLLPRPTADEDVESFESVDLLFAKLLQYRAYKVAAEHLRERERTHQRLARTAPLPRALEQAMPPLRHHDPEKLRTALVEALSEEPPYEPEHLHSPLVSVESAQDYVLHALRKSPTTFEHLLSQSPSLAHSVSQFLAILVLFKDGIIDLRQDEPLGPLEITLTESA